MNYTIIDLGHQSNPNDEIILKWIWVLFQLATYNRMNEKILQVNFVRKCIEYKTMQGFLY